MLAGTSKVEALKLREPSWFDEDLNMVGEVLSVAGLAVLEMGDVEIEMEVENGDVIAVLEVGVIDVGIKGEIEDVSEDAGKVFTEELDDERELDIEIELGDRVDDLETMVEEFVLQYSRLVFAKARAMRLRHTRYVWRTLQS